LILGILPVSRSADFAGVKKATHCQEEDSIGKSQQRDHDAAPDEVDGGDSRDRSNRGEQDNREQ